ncbi:hypothetical protein EST62_05020 [Chlorobaculum sp. 24CR]|uniref:sulfotransferase domain-containing protein n=1 Tax=Chlorobaculum sp. 24CR TaxID=2508878 RepID=UPI00100B559F|nr:sulfotransferase domain-containing protein [Chlorobaculum sp. 24CR]RXK88060.1 hypothetical protein EST62_05020 [Chlorobaculum sp. 24CR]
MLNEKLKKNKIIEIAKNLLKVRLKDTINKLLLILFGRKWKIIFINEYPKCGGTWLRYMLEEALLSKGYNTNKKEIKIIKEKHILQRHWLRYTKYAYRTIVIIRDPRDVYNSFYFHENYHNPNQKYKTIFGYDERKIDKENMYSYINSKLLYPELTTPGFSYKVFWDTFKVKKDILFIRYEDLKRDTVRELKKVFEYIGVDVDEDKINEAIKKYDFENMKKKQENADGRKNHVRKGVVGDWQNNFDENTIDLFKKYYNDTIIDMKYEDGEAWGKK